MLLDDRLARRLRLANLQAELRLGRLKLDDRVFKHRTELLFETRVGVVLKLVDALRRDVDESVARRLRKGLDELDHLVELNAGDVPLQHRGAVKAAFDDALEIDVVREPLGDRIELVSRHAKIARRRTKADRSRAAAVTVHAMACVAVMNVSEPPLVQLACLHRPPFDDNRTLVITDREGVITRDGAHRPGLVLGLGTRGAEQREHGRRSQ